MKTKKEIRERIKDIDNAIVDLQNYGLIENISELNTKIETLEWVLREGF